LGIILFVTSIFGSIFVEKIGRKWLLVCGLIGTAISNVIMIVVPLIAPNYQLIGTICAFICTKAFIGIGAGAPAWFLTSELVPVSCRYYKSVIS
jgi:MFS family permease